MRIDARTRPVVLLGYPVSHSLSPLLHNAAFQHQGLNFVYLACPVPPDDLPAALAGIRALHLAGANVTIPHKERVLPLLDELSSRAAAVGAVNTVLARTLSDTGGVILYGDNTDVPGFLAPLSEHVARVKHQPMVLLGAGGSARAIVYAALTTLKPSRLVIAARTTERALRLKDSFAPHDTDGVLEVVPLDSVRDALRSSRLIVNATPAGMHPHLDATPWPGADDFGPDHIVYDLVYNPIRTRLLNEAAARGAHTISGIEMLIGQASVAYELWTERPMPDEPVRAVLRQWQQG